MPLGTGAIPSGGDGNQPRADNGQFAQKPDQWRYPNDWRIEWQRNKTADEVANLSNQMYAELVRRQPAPASAPAPTNGAPTGVTMPTDDQWLTQPGVAAQQVLQYARNTEFAPALANMANQLGVTAREVIRMRYPDEFRKWGPEIDLYINQMDAQYRNVDNLDKVVGMVRANHIDEIAAERAQKRLDEMIASGTVLRPGAAPNGPGTAAPGAAIDLAKSGLPDNYARLLQRYGVTSETLDEFLMKTDVAATGCTLAQARERWLERAKAGDIITERPTGAVV